MEEALSGLLSSKGPVERERSPNAGRELAGEWCIPRGEALVHGR